MDNTNKQISLNDLVKIIYLYEKLNQTNNRLSFFYAFIFFLIPINLSLVIYFKYNSDAIPLWIAAIAYSLIYCFLIPVFLNFLITKVSPYAQKIEDKSNFIFKNKVGLKEKLDWFKNNEYSLSLCEHILEETTFEINIKNQIFWISVVLFLLDFLIIIFAFLVSFNIIH